MGDDDRSGWRERDVVVPIRLYKTVTVFSTLIAMVCVILGFAVIDVATNRARAPIEDVNVAGALAGLALIAFGGAVYAYGGRFRASGMGNSKDRGDEDSDNG